MTTKKQLEDQIRYLKEDTDRQLNELNDRIYRCSKDINALFYYLNVTPGLVSLKETLAKMKRRGSPTGPQG